MTRLMIVVGSIRQGRIGLPIAEWVRRSAEDDGRFEVDWADLAEVGLPLMDEPNHPRLQQYTRPHTQEWSARVASADAFLFVTPEYNYSYAPSVKNAIDYLSKEWFRKPAGFVSYGGVSGGTRGVVALRPVLSAVGLVGVTPNVELAFAASQIGDDGEFQPTEKNEHMLAAELNDLATLADGLKPLRH